MEGTAQTILTHAGQLLAEEYRQLSGVGGEVLELRDDLATMNALLRMQSEAEDGTVDHFVREWMKQLRELAYDSEDCIDLYKLRIKSRPSDGVRAWLERLLGTILPRRRLAGEIRALRARAIAISERHARYGVDREALRRSTTFAPPVLASASAQALRRANDDDPEHQQEVVAIGDQAHILAERMKASVEEERHLRVFSIVGFQGVDRTSLAVEVSRRLEAEVPFQAMVVVSQAFEPSKDLKPLLKLLLEQVVKLQTDNERGVQEEEPLGDIDGLDLDQLAGKLEETLKDKRYLIVIDDVWTTTAWDAIQSMLPENNMSSRIIVTTPTETVAKACSPDSVRGHHIHHVEALSLDYEHPQIVGIEDQVNSLADSLKKEEGRLMVFSIVGFGGVGKTTLAMAVCQKLEVEFPIQAVVSVSQAFEPSRDLKVLLKRALQQVVKPKMDVRKGIKEENPLDGIDSWDADKLANELKQILKDNRYLIVIDDVWTIHAWDAIQSMLPENNKGSRIIVTTRIKTVAQSCSSDNIHHMKALNIKDSEDLFLSRAFGSMHASYPSELKDVMGDILKKCGGLPLAIVSIASVLAGYRSSASKDKWETICKSIGFQMESNPTLEGMKHIVTLSYNHLPHELKGCMMYLSIFPEDHEIRTIRLLRRWIAEGLVPEKRGLTPMEVAETYLDELVSRNMIVPHYGYIDGKVEWCRVHDMLLEVMVSKSLECNFISLLGGQYEAMPYDRIRRLSIHGALEQEGLGDSPPPHKKKMASSRKNKKMEGCCVEGLDVKHVRSLSMFQHHGHTKLLDHLDKFSLLRVLDLEDCEGLTNDHMKLVCRLYLLRFLSVKGTNVSKMPSQVGKLEQLLILDAGAACLDGLPITVTNLVKLERIEFRHKHKWSILWNLPRGIKKMKGLREFHQARLTDDVQVADELGELPNLQNIGMYIDCEDDPQVLQKLALSLSKLYSLRKLNISNMSCATGKKGGRLDFLHDMGTPPRLLRLLRLEGVLDRLPPWVESLTYLGQIVIMHTRLADDHGLFSVLCKLPNLKSIVMQQKCYMNDQIVARTGYSFPVLSHLEVTSDWIPQPKVFRFESGSMQKLETLCVSFSTLQRSIVGVEHLSNLKEVQLMGKKDNPSLNRALEELKAENSKRPMANQFQVIVKYD